MPLLSLLAVLGAVLCFAEGTVLARRFPSVHPVTANAVGMGVGAAILVVLALLFGDAIEVPERGATWLALAYLVVLGSGPVFVALPLRRPTVERVAGRVQLRADPARRDRALGLDRQRADRRGLVLGGAARTRGRVRRGAAPGRERAP